MTIIERLLEIFGFLATSTLGSPEFLTWKFRLSLLGLLISLILISLYLYIYFKAQIFKEQWLSRLAIIKAYRILTKKEYEKKWRKIKEKFKKSQGDPDKLKEIIFEIFHLLFEILEIMGYEGKTLKEKTEKISPKLTPRFKELQRLGKLEELLKTKPNYQLTTVDSEIILKSVEEILIDLGISNSAE